MATVNHQTVTVSANAITLTGSPTGSGVYTVLTGGPASVNLTAINGGSPGAVITLHAGVTGQYFVLVHNGTTINLREGGDFEPSSVKDRITMRLDEAGTAWIEEIPRGRFP